jgi:hypothetical protein
MSTIINATTTNGVVIQPDNSGSLQLATNSGTTAVTIDTSQNVGIGTTSPNAAAKLEASGSSNTRIYTTSTATSSTFPGFIVKAGTQGNLELVQNSGNGEAYFYNNANAAMTFATNATERMRIDSSGNLLFNSGYGSVATAYGCRAWVNFNGTGTVAIRASGNVSSITDTGVGQYTINFTNAMPDANYSTTMTCQDTGVPMLGTTTPVTTASVKMLVCVRGSTSTVDPVICCAAVIR